MRKGWGEDRVSCRRNGADRSKDCHSRDAQAVDRLRLASPHSIRFHVWWGFICGGGGMHTTYVEILMFQTRNLHNCRTNAAGQSNLAPFSFFNIVSANPASLMFSVTAKSNGEMKVRFFLLPSSSSNLIPSLVLCCIVFVTISKQDTLRNILETKQFVVNTVSEWMVLTTITCTFTCDPFSV